MMNDSPRDRDQGSLIPDQTLPAPDSAPDRLSSEGRRQVLRAGLASTPVILTLTARPVWGMECSLSGILSGNVSNQVHDCTLGMGCTPGFWKSNLAPWTLTLCSPGTCLTSNKKGECTAVAAATGTTFFELFGIDSLEGSGLSLMEVLQRTGGQGQFNLDQHAVAAMLNARAFDGYGASAENIMTAYRNARESDSLIELEKLKYVFAYMNERGCPLTAHGTCEPTIDIDINGDGTTDLCAVPVAVDDQGRCVGIVTQEMLLTPSVPS